MPLNQQTKKGVTPLAGVTDPSYQGETGLLVYNRGKEDLVGNPRDSQVPLRMSMPKIKGQWKTTVTEKWGAG